MIQLKLATIKDIKTINKLATTIWNQHYVPIIGQKQVDYMLKYSYNEESLRVQITGNVYPYYLIKYNTTNIGFLSISKQSSVDYFLHKFYINQTKAHKGFGTVVLAQLIDMIKPQTLRLTVNRQNFKSINFYFKNGFVIEHVEDFDIGSGYVMNDFVMVRK